MTNSEGLLNMNYYLATSSSSSSTCSCVHDAVEFLQLLESSDSKIWGSSIARAKERTQQYAAVPACPWFSQDCYEKYAYLVHTIAKRYLEIIQDQQSQYTLRIGDFVMSCSLNQEDRRQTLLSELEEFNSMVIQQLLAFTEGKGEAVTMTRHSLLEAQRLIEECLQPA
jgi:hypothetical protein